MAHVMSLISFPMSIGFMSHVDFKKRPCRPVEFRGQGPHMSEVRSRIVGWDWIYPPKGVRIGIRFTPPQTHTDLPLATCTTMLVQCLDSMAIHSSGISLKVKVAVLEGIRIVRF